MMRMGEHSYRAGDPVGGDVLTWWRASGAGGETWVETLCLEPLSDDTWRLVVAGESLGRKPRLVQYDDERCWIVGKGDLQAALDVLEREGIKDFPEWNAITEKLRSKIG